MTIYFLLLIYVCVVGFLFFHDSRKLTSKRNKWFIILTFVPMFLIQALRAESVGADTDEYVNFFYLINHASGNWLMSTYIEPGYQLLNRVVGALFGENYTWLLASVSAIVLIGFGRFIYQNCEDISAFFPVFLFVALNQFVTSMVSLRQYCSIAIGINIYTMLKRNSQWKMIVKSLIIIALLMSFHTSAIVLVLIPIFYKLKPINQKKICIVLVAGVVLYFSFVPVMNMLFRIFPVYARYASGRNYKFFGAELDNALIIIILAKLVILVCLFVFVPKAEENQEIYMLLLLSMVSAITGMMTMKSKLVWRFGYYFDAFFILLLPRFADKVKRGRVVVGSLYCLAGWAYYIFMITGNSAACVPYKFFWQ